MDDEIEITIIRRVASKETTTRWADITIEKAVGKNLVEVLAQVPLLIARIQAKIVEEIKLERGIIDDDVPF